MIILGDIASPTPRHSELLNKVFQEHSGIFKGKSLICNFEGLINDFRKTTDNTPILFNHSTVLEVLALNNIKAVGLANNHILDLPENFNETVNLLKYNGIAFSGAATNKREASEPAHFKDMQNDVFMFNACWDFLLYHQKNPTKDVHIATINEKKLLKSVSNQRLEYPGSTILVFLHWSFDLEILPFPMYRQFAKDLIENGANLVIGTHSHCVQGGEKHKDGYIIYSLGNFFLPYRTFANSYLSFPDFSRLQLAFEWDLNKKIAICHWFEYENKGEEHSLKFIKSEGFEHSAILQNHSPFIDLTDNEYVEYFKKKRRKNFLVPVYIDYSKIFTNRFYTFCLSIRGRIARILAKYKIRKWQN